MFLIAGVQPKRISMGKSGTVCPACGLAQVESVRIDHFLSLFFIPLFRVKKGEEFLFCNRCNAPVDLIGTCFPDSGQAIPSRCPSCSHPVSPDFNFCPGCGRRL